MNVLHVLYQSHPDISGSSIRSKSLVESQYEAGIRPVVVTSPFQQGYDKNVSIENINNIKYYRTNKKDYGKIGQKKNLAVLVSKLLSGFSFYKKVREIAKSEQIDIIHAHAMFYCGITAWLVAKKMNIPFVYEIRSVWEENENYSSNILRKIFRFLEHYVSLKANAVVVINQSLKDKFLNSNSKIYVVPNAINDRLISINKTMSVPHVDEQKIFPRFGYVGSLNKYEGLDYVIKAFALLDANGIHPTVNIFGEGPMMEELVKLKNKHSLSFVNILGSVAYEKINDAFSEIDCIINYRIKLNITNTVTPLKPLEALAYKKLFIGSDVNGIKELLSDFNGLLLVKSNSVIELSKVIQDVYTNFEKYYNNINEGFEYVKYRTWSVNASRYKEIYSKLL